MNNFSLGLEHIPYRIFTPLGLLAAVCFWIAVLNGLRWIASRILPRKRVGWAWTVPTAMLLVLALLITPAMPQAYQNNWLTNLVSGQMVIGGPLGTTASAIFVSAICGGTTTCPLQTDECVAINSIISANSCTIAGGGSCHIVDDMIGHDASAGTCSQSITSTATGRLDFVATGAAHELRMDGTDTFKIPTSFQIHGLGGSSADASAMNTKISACNPATDNCVNGGFTVQSSAGIPIGLTFAGANPTATMQVTLASGTPFSTSTTAFNSIGTVANPRIGRLMCIYGATANYNGCWPLLSVQTVGAGQQFTLSWDSTISNTSCASPCTLATVYLDTPLVSIGTGNGTNTSGTFHNRIGDVILDGHLMPGVGGLVNAQGEEGSGTDGTIQMYNFPTYGLRLEESSAYAGNCNTGNPCGANAGAPNGIGVANHGPYGVISINFNPFIVTKGGSGAACTNSGQGDCAGGFVAAGGKITMGNTAAGGLAILSGAPLINPNYICVMITGAAGNQGGGPLTRLTCSGQDKTGSGANQGMFLAAGASTPTGIYVQGQGDFDIINSHTEFLNDGVNVCGDNAKNVVWNQIYGAVATYAVKFDTGKWDMWPASGGILADVGTSGGTQALCSDIEFGDITTNLGGASGSILTDNLLGKTITASATIQSLHYQHGQGTANVPWISSNNGVGIGNSLTNLVNPLRDLGGRFVLAANMTGATGTAGLGSTGGGNTTFSWPVTAANWYDLKCDLPTTFASTATVQWSLYSVSGAVTISFGNIDARGNTGAAAAYQDVFLLNGASLAATITPVSGAPGAAEWVTVSSQFLTSHAGNIGIQFTSANANVTLLKGGQCQLTQIN